MFLNEIYLIRKSFFNICIKGIWEIFIKIIKNDHQFSVKNLILVSNSHI
jgi:hypothetical protein